MFHEQFASDEKRERELGDDERISEKTFAALSLSHVSYFHVNFLPRFQECYRGSGAQN